MNNECIEILIRIYVRISVLRVQKSEILKTVIAELMLLTHNNRAGKLQK